jgi:sugar (pentulose or hexulose) kinase
MNTYLGIDCGTSAIRACLIDDQETQLALTRQPLKSQEPAAWQEAILGCLQELFQHHSASSVQSIAVDGTSGTVLLCDHQGTVLTDVLMYNDASSAKQLQALNPLSPSPALSVTAGLPKAMQLAGQINGSAAIIQHQADWITGWLSEKFGYTDENNALKTGYDLQTRQWPDWVIDAFPENITLPKVKIPGTVIGHAGKTLQSLGVSPTATVVAGTTDSTAAFLATSVTQPDQGVTTLGSTLVVKQLSQNEIIDLDRGIYSHRLGNAWLTGGASNTGGNVLKKYFTDDQIKPLSQQMKAEQDTGLDYYPLTTPGERFPAHDPDLRPRLQPRPEEDSVFLQGMMEGIAQIEARSYQALKSLGTTPIKQVITSGGGAVNPVWNQIRERILRVPVSPAGQTEAAYGVARLAKNGTRLFERF